MHAHLRLKFITVVNQLFSARDWSRLASMDSKRKSINGILQGTHYLFIFSCRFPSTDRVQSVWATNITYSSSTTFIKLAILFQYLRLFDFRSRAARHVTWTMIAVVSLWGVIFFSLALFSCRPIEKNWNWKMPGKCVGWGTKDPGTFFPSWATHSASNMFIDILILVLPIPFLRALRIQGRERLALIGLFVVGTM